MKKLLLLFILITLQACKKDSNKEKKAILNKTQIVDSINVARTKHNDSIKILNSKNRFRDLSGTHQLKHSSIAKAGKLELKNIGRDLYEVSGGIQSGKNRVKITGELKMVSEEYLNFTGEIAQNILENNNGKLDIRTKKTSFAKKGTSKYWRLQNMTNSSGFADYIDLYL